MGDTDPFGALSTAEEAALKEQAEQQERGNGGDSRNPDQVSIDRLEFQNLRTQFQELGEIVRSLKDENDDLRHKIMTLQFDTPTNPMTEKTTNDLLRRMSRKVDDEWQAKVEAWRAQSVFGPANMATMAGGASMFSPFGGTTRETKSIKYNPISAQKFKGGKGKEWTKYKRNGKVMRKWKRMILRENGM